MRKKTELVEVTLKLPKLFIDFPEDKEEIMGETVKEYLERAILHCVGADLDEGETFVQQTKDIIEEYGLKDILKGTVLGL